jgi:predicted RNA-binding protein
LVPIELDEVYPLSQHETVTPLDNETVKYVTEETTEYLRRAGYEKVIFVSDPGKWGQTMQKTCRETCRQKQIRLRTINIEKKKDADLSSSHRLDRKTVSL